MRAQADANSHLREAAWHAGRLPSGRQKIQTSFIRCDARLITRQCQLAIAVIQAIDLTPAQHYHTLTDDEN